MKNKIISPLKVLIIILAISITSCKKDDVGNSDMNVSFGSRAEINAEINKTISLSLKELEYYESLKGFKSYGRICDEIYESIDFNSFKTHDEILDFVAKNSDYLELVS